MASRNHMLYTRLVSGFAFLAVSCCTSTFAMNTCNKSMTMFLCSLGFFHHVAPLGFFVSWTRSWWMTSTAAPPTTWVNSLCCREVLPVAQRESSAGSHACLWAVFGRYGQSAWCRKKRRHYIKRYGWFGWFWHLVLVFGTS